MLLQINSGFQLRDLWEKILMLYHFLLPQIKLKSRLFNNHLVVWISIPLYFNDSFIVANIEIHMIFNKVKVSEWFKATHTWYKSGHCTRSKKGPWRCRHHRHHDCLLLILISGHTLSSWWTVILTGRVRPCSMCTNCRIRLGK